MLSAPSSSWEAALEALIVASFALWFGYLIADALIGHLQLERITRWALAVPGIACFVFVLELLHIATGGAVFSSRLLTGALTVGTAVSLQARKAYRGFRRRPTVTGAGGLRGWVLAALVALGLLLWCLPVARMLPLNLSGDMKLHAAWTSQLLNGEETPSLLLTGEAPNSYPWLFHATLAWLAQLTPGGRALHALGPLQILLVAGGVLGLFALGEELGRRWTAGAAAALFGAMTGGLGFTLLRGLDVVTSPRGEGALRYGGDLLVRRSYNLAFHNLVPPYPRELAYSLTVSFLLLAVLGASRGSFPLLCGAGLVMGLIGLTGGETEIVAFGVAVLFTLLSPREQRGRTALALFVPALLVYGVWLVPLAGNYLRLGGFVDTSAPPVVLPPIAILFSWGVVTPFAVYGAARRIPRAGRNPVARLMLAQLLAAAAAVLAASFVLSFAGPGFATLGRPHRYWPLLYLAAVLYAALGASDALEWLLARGRALAVAGVSLTLVLAVPSPLFASLAMPAHTRKFPLIESAMRGEDTLLNELSPALGAQCVAAVPPELGPLVSSYTGYRLVSYGPDPRGEGARQVGTRWRNVPGLISDEQRLVDNEILTTGSGPPAAWREIVRRYEVDLVVAGEGRAGAPAFAGVTHQRVSSTSDHHLIVSLDQCGQ